MRLRTTTPLAAAAALCLAAACTSPGMGYRPQSTDPDLRLAGLMAVYRGADVDEHCSEFCEADEGEPCENCSWLRDDRGHIVVDANRTRIEIERMLLEFPHHAPTLFAAASISYEEGEFEEASSYLDELFARQPAHPEAGVLRSRIAIEEGNLSGARRVLQRQIRFTPDHAGLREAHSATLFLDGEFGAALEALDVAERLGAPAWRVAFHRGLIAETAGNPRAAIAQYETTLAERPDHRAATARRDGLLATAGEEAF